jgi:archaemetzincin
MRGDDRIGLISLGKISDKGLIDSLAVRLSEAFGREVEVSAKFPSPRYGFDERRGQYHSTTILARLRAAFEGVYDKILGIADVDLFAPPLNFVFGEADLLHGVAVISLFRLRPESYGLPENFHLLLERALKEAIHELGHTYGLMHCNHYRCVMHFSNSLPDTDRKSHQFCRPCRSSLTAALAAHSR